MKQFFTWRSAVLNSDLGFTTKGLLLVISTFMDDHGGGCFPSQNKISELSGVARETVNRHIKIAAKAGFLKISKAGFAGKKWAQNEYNISFPSHPENVVTHDHNHTANDVTEDHNQMAKVVTHDHIGSDGGSHKVVTEDHTNSPINSPINSPYSSLGKKSEKHAKINQSKKRDTTSEPRHQITDLIDLGQPMPREYVELAQRECQATLPTIEKAFRHWYYWWSSIDERDNRATDFRTTDQWLSCWGAWVCKNITGKDARGGNNSGRTKPADNTARAAALEIARVRRQNASQK